MKDYEIFNKRELRLLYKSKPELKPLRVPSIDEADTVIVPSIDEANLLKEPSIDQAIVEFLKKFEVEVKPSSVGEWNGWDLLASTSNLFSNGYGNNIGSTMFYVNRSNQLQSAAQEWSTWKRWVFDTKEKEFEQFKKELKNSIIYHNKKVTNELKETIRKAELWNKNAVEKIKDNIKKVELENSTKLIKLQEPELKIYVSELVRIENFKNKKEKQRYKVFFKKVILRILGNKLGFNLIKILREFWRNEFIQFFRKSLIQVKDSFMEGYRENEEKDRENGSKDL